MFNLLFCVFSYNRADLLENCIKSIEICAPESSIIIFDDNSDDIETVNILNKYKHKHKIYQPEKNKLGHKTLGGLYNNMQMALSILPKGQLFCFIQDDMQCVRKITQDDIYNIQRYFDDPTNSPFLFHLFLRGKHRKRDIKNTKWNKDKQIYFSNSRRSHFCAVFIGRTDLLTQVKWQFEQKEILNDKKASKLFSPMGKMKNPFCLWLPMVPLYRGKKKTLSIKLAEYLFETKLYTVNYMSESEAASFQSRNPKILPVAEDFLTLKNNKLPTPWKYDAIDRSKFLKRLNRLEIKLRSLTKRLFFR